MLLQERATFGCSSPSKEVLISSPFRCIQEPPRAYLACPTRSPQCCSCRLRVDAPCQRAATGSSDSPLPAVTPPRNVCSCQAHQPSGGSTAQLRDNAVGQTAPS